jgi:hypothetical protein
MKIFCIVLSIIFFLVGILVTTIPDTRVFGIIVMAVGLFIFWLGFANAKQKKEKEKFSQALASDDRLKGAKIFELVIDNMIVISETGYIGLKNDKIKEFLKIIHINDINGFELNVNGNMRHNTGGAIAGGLLFGGIGALIGGQSKEIINKLSFLFKINDFSNPIIEIPLILFKVKKGSFSHQAVLDKANEIISLLEILEKKYKAGETNAKN